MLLHILDFDRNENGNLLINTKITNKVVVATI